MNKKPSLLISACLLGERCRYDGMSKPVRVPDVIKERFELIPICPEVMGGLETPRLPAERVGDRVINSAGGDVTENYMRGAAIALDICRRNDCRAAVLKEKSPSCGIGRIYDGSFTRTLKDGNGVSAELMAENGIALFGESDLEDENKLLKLMELYQM